MFLHLFFEKLNKMEDFSRFLIFEFEISNADPDSRLQIRWLSRIQKEFPFSRTPNTQENPFQRENIERESPFHRQAIDTVSYLRRLRHRYSTVSYTHLTLPTTMLV